MTIELLSQVWLMHYGVVDEPEPDVEPEPVDPGVVEPGVVEPGVVEPGVVDPIVGSEGVSPDEVEPDGAVCAFGSVVVSLGIPWPCAVLPCDP